MSVDHDKIKRLISLVEENRLTELSLDEEDLSVSIKAEPQVARVPTELSAPLREYHESVADEFSAVVEEQPEKKEPSSEHLVEIKSPMVGVFYRYPSPDSPPYIEVGDQVEVGQTIGLIEAMKVFSEVPCEAAGVIAALPAASAKLVHQGDVLAVIDTSHSA